MAENISIIKSLSLHSFLLSYLPFLHIFFLSLKVSINSSSICDFILNCDNGEDEVNCTDDERFYCESGIPLFVRRRQVKKYLAILTRTKLPRQLGMKDKTKT